MWDSDNPRSLSKVVFFFKPGSSPKIYIILISFTPGAKEMQTGHNICCQKALIMMNFM